MKQSADRHLLLVASGESAHGLPRRARAHAELVNPVACPLPLSGEVEQTAGRARGTGCAEVVGDRERQGEPFTLPILAHVAHALADPLRRAGLSRRPRAAVELDRAAVRRL